MRRSVVGVSVRLTIFVLVCGLGTFTLLMIFAQLRFQDEQTYNAEFTNVTGLENGNFVRIAGVEVGKVKHISIRRDATAVVEFSADDSVVLTEGTRALIRYDNVIGGRYLELKEGTGEVKRLNSGATIPVDRTEPALDLDALIGGFRPLFRALDPEKVNALSAQLIAAFQGQGASISSFLAQSATFTGTLADREELIGQVVSNLNLVLGSLGDQSTQFAKAVDSLSQLMGELAAHKTAISDSVANTNAAAVTIADLLGQARPPLKNVVAQSDRADALIVADHDYVDNLLKTLPDKYQALARQGIYGDYFSFYFCDILLKLNGKGGQPVYVKVAGQDTGRCAPK
jgi:phospholipid/cholesterol/gamma-HCH transport system substrate-binding protein